MVLKHMKAKLCEVTGVLKMLDAVRLCGADRRPIFCGGGRRLGLNLADYRFDMLWSNVVISDELAKTGFIKQV